MRRYCESFATSVGIGPARLVSSALDQNPSQRMSRGSSQECYSGVRARREAPEARG